MNNNNKLVVFGELIDYLMETKNTSEIEKEVIIEVENIVNEKWESNV